MKKCIYITSFALGILFFCIYQEWLVIYWNRPSKLMATHQNNHTKQSVFITLWKDNQWLKKGCTIMHEENETAKLAAITTAWLLSAYDQQLLLKKITLEKAEISPSGTEGFLSFSESFFDQEATAQEHLFLIESLLKTLQNNNISCQQIMFLAQDQPLNSLYLDFSLPWPLQGFLSF